MDLIARDVLDIDLSAAVHLCTANAALHKLLTEVREQAAGRAEYSLMRSRMRWMAGRLPRLYSTTQP